MLPFLKPLATNNTLGAAIATTLVPAVAGILFIILTVAVVHCEQDVTLYHNVPC